MRKLRIKRSGERSGSTERDPIRVSWSNRLSPVRETRSQMRHIMNRRSFLGAAAGAVLASAGRAQAAPIPVIDTHIHLFDPTRPEGVPWPPKDGAVPYLPTLPDRFRQVSSSSGVVGAIEVECSPWLEDNQWVLDVSEKDPIMVGTVGNLQLGEAGFARNLERFHKNRLYRGIRYGHLWGRDFHANVAKADGIAGLKLLAEADLVLDTVGPSAGFLEDVVRITDAAPNLRIVIDHLPRLARPQQQQQAAAYDAAMRELGQRGQVYAKVSEVLNRIDGRVPRELSFYRPKLDELWETFGEDRLLYGSDWPNSDPLGTYEQVFGIVSEYFTAKGTEASEKYFWKNSVAAYKWVRRADDQPAASPA
jgi:predicted TIM-barrel fold metal-dependent hydrolase